MPGGREVSGACVAFVLVAVVLPGVGLQRWLRLQVDPALVAPLGAVVAASAQALGLATGRPSLAVCLVSVAAAGVLLGRPRLAERPPLALAPAAVVLLALLAATQWRGNRPAADGGFLLDPMGDQPLHAGLAWELTLAHPQVPGLAGVPLSYHVGADLVRAAALQWAGVRPYAPLNREEPALWALALMLVLASFTRRLGAPPLAVALVPFTVLMTDFSWLCAVVPGLTWWSDVFRGNVLISMAFANPVVPALALALGALVALARHDAGEGRGWLVLAALQAAAVPWFKVFLGAQLAAGLLLAGALALRRRAGAARGPGPPGSRSRSASSPRRRRSRSSSAGPASRSRWPSPRCGSWPVPCGSSASSPRSRESCSPPCPGSSSRWACGSSACATLFARSSTDPRSRPPPPRSRSRAGRSRSSCTSRRATSRARSCPRRRSTSSSSPASSSGCSPPPRSPAPRRATRRPALMLAAVALLGVPSTVEFALRKARVAPDPVPAAVVRALEAIARDGRPGDVVLQRPGARYPPLPAVLEGRRVVYERFTPYLTQFAPRAELQRRHEALFRFFRTTDAAEAAALAREFGARYLCLYGADRVRFDTAGAARAAPRGGRRARLPDRHRRAAARAGRRRRGRPHPRRAIIPLLRREPTVDFVLNRKGGVPLHDQLLAQLEMKILGGAISPGQRLPSVRALARRLGLHANTVSGAYRDLEKAGHVELRRGAGVYVRAGSPASVEDARGLDEVVRLALSAAFRKGFSGAEIRAAVERWLRAAPAERVVIVDPREETLDILVQEVKSALAVP